jgi:hypothetical protein
LLAEAATPGPWAADGRVRKYVPGRLRCDTEGGSIIAWHTGGTVVLGGARNEDGMATGAVGCLRRADWDFIAAANPEIVLALLDALDAAEAGGMIRTD